MTFAANIVQSGTGVLWYCRISGLPYVWCNADLPAAWLTGGDVVIASETYTVSKTLVARGGWTTKQSAMPKAGIAGGSGLSLPFQLDATWLDLISTQIYRSSSARTSVVAAVGVADVALSVNDITGFADGEDLYVGLETMAIDGTPAGSTLDVVRGRYGSQPLPIELSIDGGAFGCYVADHPLTHHGRVVSLWMATGKWSNGTFVPNGANIESAEDQLVFRGVVAGLQTTKDLQRVVLDVQSLDGLLAKHAGTRLPEAQHGWPDGYVAFSPGSDMVRLQFQLLDAGGNVVDQVLTKTFNAPDRLYSYSEFITAVNQAIDTGIDDYDLTSIVWDAPLSISVDDDGALVLSATFSAAGAYAAYLIQRIVIDCGKGSAFRALGFTGEIRLSVGAPVTGQSVVASVAAERGRPRCFLPRYYAPGQVLWYRDQSELDMQSVPGHRSDVASLVTGDRKIRPAFLVGNEVVSCYEIGLPGYYYSTGAALVQAGTRATVTRRQQAGTELQEHYVGYDEDEGEKVTQVLTFPLTGLPRAWLYLLVGGSGVHGTNGGVWDRDWAGGGAHIDADLVDINSFVAQAERLAGYGLSEILTIAEPTALRDLMQGDLILLGLSVVAGADQIRLVDVSPPTVADATAAVLALTSANTRTTGAGGVQYDQSERRIVNDINAEHAYDVGLREYRARTRSIDAVSVGTWGRSDQLLIQSRGIGSQSRVDAAAKQILGAYSRPYVVLTVDVTTPAWYTVEVGDIVTLTHELVPTVMASLAEITPGRGVTAVPARVLGTERIYPADGQRSAIRGRATLVIAGASDAHACPWAPAAKATAWDEPTLTFTVESHVYSSAGDATTDARYVAAAGYEVMIRDYSGGAALIGPYTVASVTDTTIALDEIPDYVTCPLIIEPALYSNASLQDAQRPVAYMVGTDLDLDLSGGGGTHPPRRYR